MYLATILCVILVIASAEETCTPPQQLINNEGRCLELETTFFQRVQHEAKGLFASAKRKLGIDPNAQEEPLNCSYYACVLQGLGMANSNGTLVLEEIKNWINKNIPNEYKDEFTLHAAKCFENNGKILILQLINDSTAIAQFLIKYLFSRKQKHIGRGRS